MDKFNAHFFPNNLILTRRKRSVTSIVELFVVGNPAQFSFSQEQSQMIMPSF